MSNTYEDGIGRLTFDNDVSAIASKSFQGCTSLVEIKFSDSVTSIGWEAFFNCTSLTSVYYKGDLSAWCKIKFQNYSSNPLCNGAKLYLNGSELTYITIPSDITEIKDRTFYGRSSLTSVTIPDSVTSIGSSAFRDCTSLKEVYCKAIAPPAGGINMFPYYIDDFSYEPIGCKIYVPTASVEAYKSAPKWSEYASNIIGYDFEE